YDNGVNDEFTSVKSFVGSPDYYLVGNTNVTGNKNIVFTKMMGDVPEWTQIYGGATEDFANIVDYSTNMGGMFVIAGKTFNGTDFDALAFDVDMSGNIMGTSYTYDLSSGNEEFMDLISDGSSNFIGVGYAEDGILGKQCLAVYLGTGSAGVEEYNSFTFGGGGEDVLNCGLNLMGNYYVAGYTTTLSVGGKDVYIANIDPTNSMVFMDTTYGSFEDDAINDMVHNYYDNTMLAVGYTTNFGTGDKDIYVLKISSSLDTLWTKKIGGSGNEEAFSVLMDGDFSMGGGNYIISGYTTSYGTDTNIYQVKIDDLGNILWHGYVDQTGTQIAYDAALRPCDFALAGKTNLVSSQNDGYLVTTPRVNIVLEGTDVTCFGGNDGTASVEVTGGSYKLIFEWEDQLHNTIVYDQPTITALTAGTYYIAIDDMELYTCIFGDSIIIQEPEVISTTLTSTDVTCTGIANGTAEIIVSGGVNPYVINWSTGSTEASVSGLEESVMYGVTVTDFNGCVIDQEFSIYKQNLAAVYGTVLPYTGGDIPDGMATVELLKINGLGNVELVTSVELYSMGFDFSDMEPANYIIRVALDPSLAGEMMPTYYGDIHNWELATVLEAGCDSTFETVVIQMAECPVTFDGDGTFSGTILLVTNGAKDVGEPVPGAEIYLEQEPEGEPIAVTTSDENGDYDFDSLPVNVTYSLSVDIPGFPLIQTYQNITVTDVDTVFEDLNFYVDTTSGDQGVYTEDPFISVPSVLVGKAEISVFPNPSNDIFNINYSLNNEANVRINVLDGNGRIIGTLINQKQYSGEYKLEINNQIIKTKGMYFLQMQIDNKVYLKKLVLQ
ncbi:MAG: carboxypeptidase regulatory-like domain-containing protein, partial [Bacteroidales bacterium]|nr:carboxypeptidase regulatory-like domain-containing protein [Bacteroidales bacterium]